MATHSSILVWESHGQRSLVDHSPWGCKRVRHHLVTIQQHAFLTYAGQTHVTCPRSDTQVSRVGIKIQTWIKANSLPEPPWTKSSWQSQACAWGRLHWPRWKSQNSVVQGGKSDKEGPSSRTSFSPPTSHTHNLLPFCHKLDSLSRLHS